jgi:hypothetical protein
MTFVVEDKDRRGDEDQRESDQQDDPKAALGSDRRSARAQNLVDRFHETNQFKIPGTSSSRNGFAVVA